MEVHLTPEHETFILKRIHSGRFASPEEAVEEAVSLLEAREMIRNARNSGTGQSLVEVCSMVKGQTEDVDFSRDPSFDRPLDLS